MLYAAHVGSPAKRVIGDAKTAATTP